MIQADAYSDLKLVFVLYQLYEISFWIFAYSSKSRSSHGEKYSLMKSQEIKTYKKNQTKTVMVNQFRDVFFVSSVSSKKQTKTSWSEVS